MLELYERLDQHAVCVEHKRTVVSMLLNLPVIVEPGATLALEGTDLLIRFISRILHHSSPACVLMVTITPLHLLLFILKLLIIRVLVLVLLRIVLLTRLIIGRSLLHIHTRKILLIHSVNFLLLMLLFFLAGENIRHRIWIYKFFKL